MGVVPDYLLTRYLELHHKLEVGRKYRIGFGLKRNGLDRELNGRTPADVLRRQEVIPV